MEFTEIIALSALVVSALAVFYSIKFGMRDRAHIKTKSIFAPELQTENAPFGPTSLIIEIRNHGRRVVQLEYLYFQYGKKGPANFAETFWRTEEDGSRGRLGEGGKYEHVIMPDHDSILWSDGDGPATDIYFQDTLGNQYYVKDAKKNLKAYLKATEDG